MATLEDKINLFTKVIFDRLESEYEARRQRLLDQYEQEKAGITGEYEKRKEETIEEVKREAEIKKQRMISKALSDRHLSLLKKRQELVDRIMDEVKRQAGNFIETPAYGDFLKKAVSEVTCRFTPGQFVIYRFSARDVEKNGREIADFIKTLRSEDSFRIEKCDDMVGGVFARSGDGRVEVDYTVNTTIEESRRLVGELISQRLGEGV